MKLYHYTHHLNFPSIRKKGLSYRFRESDWSATEAINGVLERYKPHSFPTWKNRDACLFFEMEEYGRNFDLHSRVVIETKDLDLSRLYIAPKSIANRIWEDTVDASYGGESSGIPLEESTKTYWDHCIPFTEWNPSEEKDEDWEWEVLYFGEIPPSVLVLEELLSLGFSCKLEKQTKVEEKFIIEYGYKHRLRFKKQEEEKKKKIAILFAEEGRITFRLYEREEQDLLSAIEYCLGSVAHTINEKEDYTDYQYRVRPKVADRYF